MSLGTSAGGDGIEYHWAAPGVVLDDPDSATASGVFPLGQTVATFTVEDEEGCLEPATDQVLITVRDTAPPVVSCTTNPTKLFPPDHRMVPVSVAVCATDAATALTLASATATSNEKDNAPGWGDGDTVGDTAGGDGYAAPVDIAGRLTFNTATRCFAGGINLRAERAGTKTDRVYTIRGAVRDPLGNQGQGSCNVVVPHP